MEGVLEEFQVADGSVFREGSTSSRRCPSRELLEGFLEVEEECIAKRMEERELAHIAYNLRCYRHRYPDEFGNIGISARNGYLTLYKIREK